MLRGRLGGKGRRSNSNNNNECSKEAVQKAREIVQQELQTLRRGLKTLKAENKRQRNSYRQQETALEEELTRIRKQLEQRRDTLLATTSLYDYTRTIQGTSTLRLPAALLTIQARLCLHVHCLCVHEELLIKTKEQGWDVIAWMEDVSKQLRYITQQQVLNLHQELIQQASLHTQEDLPEDIQETVQDAKAYLEYLHPDQDTQNISDSSQKLIPQTTPSSAELLDQLPYEYSQQQQQPPQNNSEEEHDNHKSFSEFLQRYQQRKEAQHKVEQEQAHRLITEFRFRGVGINPYRNLHKAPQVAQKLKLYATHLLNKPNNNSSSSSIMEESFHSSFNEEERGQGQRTVKPKQWIRQGKNFVKEHYSDSNLDISLSSLGTSLKGLRNLRGSGGGGSTTHSTSTPRSVVEEDNADNDNDEQEESSFHEDDDHIHNKQDEGDDDEGSIGQDELLADLPTIASRREKQNDSHNDVSQENSMNEEDLVGGNNSPNKQDQQQPSSKSKGRLSGLKQKLRNRPVVQKFFESATW